MINKFKVLVVDDSNVIRDALNKELISRGFEVLTCEDGMDALSKIMDFGPDLIFTDITMPKIDGYELVTILRENQAFVKTPIIMLSSRSGVFDKARGHLLGCSEYLTKPVSSTNLDGVISKYLVSHSDGNLNT